MILTKQQAQNIIRKAVGLRQLERVNQTVMLDRQSRISERLAEVQTEAYARRIGAEPPQRTDEAEDDGMVQVGDNPITINEGASKLLGPLLAAALALGGLGSGIGIGMLLNDDPVVNIQDTGGVDTDTNTRYRLDGDFREE